jgi:hypothetical protein
MKEKDRKFFRRLMERAKVSLPSRMTLTIEEEALRIDVFWETLKQHSIESVSSAFTEAFRKLKWFPSPADIKELITVIEYPKINDLQQLEYKPPSKERAKEILDEVNQKIREICPDWDKDHGPFVQDIKTVLKKLKNVNPTLTGKQAEEFEKKRSILKKQSKMVNK